MGYYKAYQLLWQLFLCSLLKGYHISVILACPVSSATRLRRESFFFFKKDSRDPEQVGTSSAGMTTNNINSTLRYPIACCGVIHLYFSTVKEGCAECYLFITFLSTLPVIVSFAWRAAWGHTSMQQ